MNLDLAGKAVLVTGGSRGTGRQIALTFAEEGANVAICARAADALSRTGGQLHDLEVRVLTLQADLVQAAECQRVVDETASFFGRLDVLVNNASTVVGGTATTATDDILMESMVGKALPAIRCMRAAVPHMRQVGGGRIICICGTGVRNAYNNLPGVAATGIGNSALTNFAKQFSHEVASDQILVNVVHPCHTRTDRYPKRLKLRAEERGITLEEAEASFAAEYPIGRIIEPSDIAPLVVFLASSHASAISGQTIAVDGGKSPSIIY